MKNFLKITDGRFGIITIYIKLRLELTLALPEPYYQQNMLLIQLLSILIACTDR